MLHIRERGVRAISSKEKKMALHAKTMPRSYLSHDATWTFRDERIIGLVNAIYEGIFVYILADVA